MLQRLCVQVLNNEARAEGAIHKGQFCLRDGPFLIQLPFIYEPPLCPGRKEEDARSTESAAKIDAVRPKRDHHGLVDPSLEAAAADGSRRRYHYCACVGSGASRVGLQWHRDSNVAGLRTPCRPVMR